MKKANTLGRPLLWTAAVLIVLLAIIGIGSNPELTMLGFLKLIFMTAWLGVKWLLALSLGVLFCLIFLFAVFLGAVAVVNKKEAVRMYSELVKTIQPALNWLPQCKSQTVNFEPMRQELRQEVHTDIQSIVETQIKTIQTQIHDTKDMLTGKVEQLSARIDVLEEMTASMADSDQVETLREEVKGAVASLAGIESAVDGMKSCVEQTVAQLAEVSSEKVLGDLPERLRTLEERPQPVIDISPLEQDIAVMQQELASVREKADKALSAETEQLESVSSAVRQDTIPSDESEEHRIFSYFDDPADKVKIAETVDGALKKNMSYRQVTDAVVKMLGPHKGKVISSHPSLIKDYIRSRRRTV